MKSAFCKGQEKKEYEEKSMCQWPSEIKSSEYKRVNPPLYVFEVREYALPQQKCTNIENVLPMTR